MSTPLTIPPGRPDPSEAPGRVTLVAVIAGWATLVAVWTLLGATPSPSRWLGTALLIVLPAAVWWSAPSPVRAGLVSAGAVLLLVGVLVGGASGASVGVAVGGPTAWAAVALAASSPDLRRQRVGTVVGVVGLLLMIAPSAGHTGPRVAGAAAALLLGLIAGRAVRARPRRVPGARVRDRLAVGGSAVLIGLGATRTFIDLDAPALVVVRAVRRFASLVLPASPGLAPVGVGGGGIGAGAMVGMLGAALPWLLPLVGGGVALLLVLRRQGIRSTFRPGRHVPRPVVAPLSSVPAGILVAGLVTSALLHLVGVEWAEALRDPSTGTATAWLLWPDRRIETLLWGALAMIAGRGWRPSAHPAAAAVAGVIGLVLLTVLVGEWRVDGVALRPDLLAVPALLLGILGLARSGPRPLVTGIAIAGLPVLLIGMAVGMADVGPSRSGRRSFVPGRSVLMVEGDRLAGLLPDAGQLGIVAAAITITAALVVLSPPAAGATGSVRRATLVIAWIALIVGASNVILAEAKGMVLALSVAVLVAVVAHRSTAVRRRGDVERWSMVLGASSAVAVVAAPFVGAAVLDPAALRPEVWRRSITALEGREWLSGLGAQPLRVDREFHTRIDSSWDAVQAHNQVVELLLIAGLPGLGLMLVTTGVLVAVGLRASVLTRGWSAGAATFLIVGGASGPNLTYIGHDVASVLVAGVLVAVLLRSEPPPPDLVRLDDDPAELPSSLVGVWARGAAALVAPAGAALPTPLAAALAGPTSEASTPLPAGTALVVPTSGSTGAPRAVMLSHAALTASTAASLAALGCVPGERWALALPVRHVAGLQVLARARALGTAAYLVPDPGDPQSLASSAAHAEHIALVPTQLVRCLDAGVDLSGFRNVLVGGGPLDPDRAAEALAAGVRVVQSYGMTETCGGCVYDGRPLPGVEVEVIDGRIRLRGPMLATGYLDASPEDADRFTPDGWFVTDDLGRLHTDPDGHPLLEAIGRGDDVINTGGVKVVPAAVEALLRTVVGVADVVVVGVPDEEWGERVRAVVLASEPNGPPTLDELRQAVTDRLPSSHAPRELVLVDRIVRDGLGKLTASERERLQRAPA